MIPFTDVTQEKRKNNLWDQILGWWLSLRRKKGHHHLDRRGQRLGSFSYLGVVTGMHSHQDNPWSHVFLLFAASICGTEIKNPPNFQVLISSVKHMEGLTQKIV